MRDWAPDGESRKNAQTTTPAIGTKTKKATITAALQRQSDAAATVGRLLALPAENHDNRFKLSPAKRNLNELQAARRSEGAGIIRCSDLFGWTLSIARRP